MPQKPKTTQAKKKLAPVRKSSVLFSIAALFFSSLALMALTSMDEVHEGLNKKSKAEDKSKPKPKPKAKAKTSQRRPTLNTR